MCRWAAVGRLLIASLTHASSTLASAIGLRPSQARFSPPQCPSSASRSPTTAARSRTYCYWILAAPALSPFERGRALWAPYEFDRPALDRCAAALPGTHDFTAFTPTDTEHVRFERRILACEWRRFPLADVRPGELLELWIEADAFMRHMVRVLVGTILEVGRGRRSIEHFESLLDGAPRDRAGETAPAHGLYLASVRY